MRGAAVVVSSVVVLCVVSLTSSMALGQSPTSGQIKVWVTLPVTSSGNTPDPIVITGVIGDHGTTISVNSKGKSDANGNFERVRLSKGKFTVNGAALNQALNNAAPSDFDTATCSGSFSAGPDSVPIVNGSGTGAYAGISGSVAVSAQFAFVGPKSKNGSCNMRANPIAGFGIITGSGTISIP